MAHSVARHSRDASLPATGLGRFLKERQNESPRKKSDKCLWDIFVACSYASRVYGTIGWFTALVQTEISLVNIGWITMKVGTDIQDHRYAKMALECCFSYIPNKYFHLNFYCIFRVRKSHVAATKLNSSSCACGTAVLQ